MKAYYIMTDKYTSLFILFTLIIISTLIIESVFYKSIIILVAFFICVSFNLVSHICDECDVNKISSVIIK
jgi:hypothetical protein